MYNLKLIYAIRSLKALIDFYFSYPKFMNTSYSTKKFLRRFTLRLLLGNLGFYLLNEYKIENENISDLVFWVLLFGPPILDIILLVRGLIYIRSQKLIMPKSQKLIIVGLPIIAFLIFCILIFVGLSNITHGK